MENLASMLSGSQLEEAGVNRLLGSGGALARNHILQHEVSIIMKMNMKLNTIMNMRISMRMNMRMDVRMNTKMRIRTIMRMNMRMRMQVVEVYGLPLKMVGEREACLGAALAIFDRC